MLGIGKDDFVVTYVGRLTTEKGVLDLVEVYARLVEKNNDVKGLIVSDTLEDEHKAVSIGHLQVLLGEKQIAEEVILTGFRDDVPVIMEVSDVVVLLSKREGFGMVLAEAAAMGRPVVAYRCRGVEEAVVNNVTGFIVEPGDIEGFAEAIQVLHDDRLLAKELGAAASCEAAKRFSQKEVLGKYIAVFEEAVQTAHMNVRPARESKE